MTLKSGPNLGVLVDGALGEAHYTELMRQWRALDALIQIHVKSRSVTAQPGSPADGDAYIIPTGATGAAWSGKTNQIARFSTTTAGWEFFVPKKGWQVRVEDENNSGRPKLYVFDGAAWQDDTAAGGMTNPMSAKGDLIAGGASGAPVRVPAGTTGQVPTMQADGSVAYQDPAAGMANPMTAKGDMIAGGTGGAPTRIPKGTTGQVPTMQADGTVAFQTPGGVPPGYIDGLKLVWNSASSLSVTSGSAYIPSLSRASTSSSALTLSSLSLTASTWYHVYLFENAGTPAIECVTTAPSAPYSGTARTKTSDNSRRYIGSVLTDGSGGLRQFLVDSSGYFRHTGGMIRCLANGKATTRTSASLSAAVPVTASAVLLTAINADNSVLCNLGYSPSISINGALFGLSPVGSNPGPIFIWTTDANQNVDYAYNSTPSNGLYIDVLAFAVER
jgi:hypothetical protein